MINSQDTRFMSRASYHRPAPCKGCTNRSVGCHGKCDGYIQWKKEIDSEEVPEYVKINQEAASDIRYQHTKSKNIKNYRAHKDYIMPNVR